MNILRKGGPDMTLGSWGEHSAAKYLIRKGYIILERNFRCRLGEIDLIALDGRTLVFIEVKTRRNRSYGLPCEAVNAQKLRHLKRMSSYYITIHHAEHRDARLDVVEILTEGGRTYFRHIENILG
jgi:putative endonuclease